MNVLVVGTGSIAKRHIKNLQELDEITEIKVYSSRGVLLNDLSCSKVSAQRSLADLNNVDFAIIANETDKHVPTAIKLVEQGIHLFLEKPVSHNLQEARDLAKLADARNTLIFVGYNMRFLGAIKFLKSEIVKGRFGKILFSQIEAGQYLPDWRLGRDYKNVYSAHKKQGGGVALDLSHELDYMMYLFGFPSRWNLFSEKVSHLEIDVDDIFEGTFFFEEGMLCNVHLDYLQRSKKRNIKIVGSDGAVDCDIFGGKLTISKLDPESSQILIEEINDNSFFKMDATYKEELLSFIDTVKRGSKPEINLQDGLRVLELLEDKNV
jgi:predicted dehydrogenase